MLIPPEIPAGMSVLAVDTGTHLGWALLRRCGTVVHGVHHLPDERYPRRKHVRWASLRGFLTETKNGPAQGSIDMLYYEHSEFAVMARNAKGMARAQVLSLMDRGALYQIIQTFARHHDIQLEPVNPSSIKKAATGNGNAKKAEVSAAMRAAGFDFTDPNEGDALALLHHAFADLSSQRRVA